MYLLSYLTKCTMTSILGVLSVAFAGAGALLCQASGREGRNDVIITPRWAGSGACRHPDPEYAQTVSVVRVADASGKRVRGDPSCRTHSLVAEERAARGVPDKSSRTERELRL